VKVSVRGLSLFVEVRGEGRPLLFVHGFPLDHTLWREQLNWLPQQGSFQVIAPDLPGFGQSERLPGDVVSMERFADDLAALLGVLGIREPVVYCGLSMGGYIGWQFWKRHRAQVAALVMCDTRAAADSPEAAQVRLQNAERVLEEGPAFLADTMLERLFAPSTRKNSPDLVADVRRVMVSTSPQTIAAALRGMAHREDFTGQLATIDVPTLLVCGRQDALSPVEEMRWVADAIPSAQFVVLEDAGHLAPLEAPQAFHEALLAFLERLDHRPV